jgi:hypothetical protein
MYTHAPHHNSGRALCGAEWDLKHLHQCPTCPACIELLMEYAEEMAAFELAASGYYSEIGNAPEAAQCIANSEAYLVEASELRAKLETARNNAGAALMSGSRLDAAMDELAEALSAYSQAA